MAPFPSNNTARLYADYTSRSIGHTLLFRFPIGTDPVAGLQTAVAMLETLRSLMMTTDSFTGVRWSNAGSNITFPLTFAAMGGTQLDASTEVDPESFFFSWAGRGPVSGKRYVPKFFGSRGTQARPPDNRYDGAESTPLAAIRNAWAELANPEFFDTPIVTIGLDRPIFSQYTNVANNAYWQREQRGT